MRTKVGLLTTLVTPNPSAMPLATTVLPAPSGPISATSVPGGAEAPRARPIDLVWSGEVLSNVPLAASVGRGGTRGAAERSMAESIGTAGGGPRLAPARSDRRLQVHERDGRQPAVLQAHHPG